MVNPSTGDLPGVDSGTSDYGPGFTPDEEELLNGLLLDVATEPQLAEACVEGDEMPNPIRECRVLGRKLQFISHNSKLKGEVEISIEGDGCTQVQYDETHAKEHSIATKSSVRFGTSDAQSPLQRFRRPPKKSLSVTDLVSPAWCELQYFYSLVKYGRIKRTSVMKQGSAVHQALEEQVHKIVAIDATTIEDAWGLRLWNIIQGLRTLREAGMTRELEVWGVVDGLLVSGVIDEISFVCPDEELEAEVPLNGRANEKSTAGQTLFTDFTGSSSIHSEGGALGKAQVPPRKVYLTDVKTRKARNLPSGASFRPTLFQLMLYHRFFSNLASNDFDADILFRHYQVDVSAGLGDSFMSQIAALDGYNRNIARTGMGGSGSDKSQGLLGLLLGNNSVQGLWELMMREFRLTVPAGAQGVGSVLKVEYRSRTDGSILGQKTFLHQDELLDQYLTDEMMWWKGEREGRGVAIEEAYKCQGCEFADSCTWRIAKGAQFSGKEQKRL